MGGGVLTESTTQSSITTTNSAQVKNEETTEYIHSLTLKPIPLVNGIPINVKDVIFLHYADPLNPNNSQEIIFQGQISDETKFIRNGTFKILMHGFMQNASTNFPLTVKNAYLQLLKEKPDHEKFNVIVIDWGKFTHATTKNFATNYDTAVKSIYMVGEHVANFLIHLRQRKLLQSYAHVHIIGFSLGGQLAGITGQFLQLNSTQKIGRITGLDPAGPLFYNVLDDKKLDASDADFVDVIHTNAGFLGHSQPLGHVDIFPNGGRVQPGCEKDWTGMCSHEKSHQLYIRSISDENALIGCECESWSNFESCKGNCVDYVKAGEPCPKT